MNRPCEEDEKNKLRIWGKTFANHISNKGLVSRMCKELSELSNNINIQSENEQKT